MNVSCISFSTLHGIAAKIDTGNIFPIKRSFFMYLFSSLRGWAQNLSKKLQQKKKNVEKASSGMGEMCPKIFGGYEY